MMLIHNQYLRIGLTLFCSLLYLLMILVHQMTVVHLIVELFSSVRHCGETKYALDYSEKKITSTSEPVILNMLNLHIN